MTKSLVPALCTALVISWPSVSFAEESDAPAVSAAEGAIRPVVTAPAVATPAVITPADAKARFADAMELQPEDPEAAAREMRALADGGYARAMDRLAYFHLRGLGVPQDTDAAIALYKAAIAAGRAGARVSLGKTLMREGRHAEALDVLEQAAADADQRALATLAWGHATGRLGALARPAEGLADLRDLAAADSRDAQMSLLAALIAQPQAPADVDAVLDRLHARHEAGDAKAAESLLRYYRMRGHPRGTLAMRAALLETEGLRDKIRVEESLYLAAVTEARRFWIASEEIVATAPPDVYARALVVTARLNRNAWVRIVQQDLRDLGYRVGRPSAYMNAPLIRAINRYCRDNDMAADCREGPVKFTTIRAVATALAEDRPAS